MTELYLVAEADLNPGIPREHSPVVEVAVDFQAIVYTKAEFREWALGLIRAAGFEPEYEGAAPDEKLARGVRRQGYRVLKVLA